MRRGEAVRARRWVVPSSALRTAEVRSGAQVGAVRSESERPTRGRAEASSEMRGSPIERVGALSSSLCTANSPAERTPHPRRAHPQHTPDPRPPARPPCPRSSSPRPSSPSSPRSPPQPATAPPTPPSLPREQPATRSSSTTRTRPPHLGPRPARHRPRLTTTSARPCTLPSREAPGRLSSARTHKATATSSSTARTSATRSCSTRRCVPFPPPLSLPLLLHSLTSLCSLAARPHRRRRTRRIPPRPRRHRGRPVEGPRQEGELLLLLLDSLVLLGLFPRLAAR